MQVAHYGLMGVDCDLIVDIPPSFQDVDASFMARNLAMKTSADTRC